MNERVRILEMIESGQIGVEEGVRRLESLGQEGSGPEQQPEHHEAMTSAAAAAPRAEPQAEAASEPVRPTLISVVWQIVFGLGILVVTGGGVLLARAYGREGMPGLTWGWVLFVLGVLVMMLGWWLQQARWFYLRVREHSGRAFTIALPLPLGLVAWLLRVAKPWVPTLQEMDADELIVAMRDELRDGRGMVIAVDEGEGGDQVEMYFR